ncbi:MAG: PCRF domain-containing protein, partial [Bacteroidetes bacterium]|nr:PCRF domain-containing protein [Bacteroidota bacterium]
MTHENNFWDDPKSAEKLLKDISLIKSWVQEYDQTATLVDDVTVLYDFFMSEEATEQEVDEAYKTALQAVEKLEFRNM